MTTSLRIAADIGGTFTDIAFVTDEGAVVTRKVPSTPADYALGVVEGVRALLQGLDAPAAAVDEVLHGCTVASNAILERKGARTALITTKGFGDVLELRRVRIPALYRPDYVKPAPLVERALCFEVEERLDAEGKVVRPLDEADVEAAIAAIRAAGVEAVGVTFLHSYVNPVHEARVGEMLRAALPGCFVSLSIEVLPEIREYERTSTTVVNAYVGPPVRRYLDSLVARLGEAGVPGRLRVMQSGGGVVDAAVAIAKPAQIVECGPAAGVIGAAHLARTAGYRNLITFDMGGTTAKASIIEDGQLARTGEYEVGGGISLSSRLVKGGGYPLKLPVIDVSEVGAGGGSIVWLDKAGAIKVGPTSAAAVPGPACYGTGGTEATVTDANVVLGYLNPHALAGGTVPIDAEKAAAAIDARVARPLGIGRMQAAYGVHAIAIANMMRAVKAVSTYRGRDPRDFALLAFGGNGGIHAVSMARELEIGRILVPPAAGVFSALGLLLADVELALSRSFLRLMGDVDLAALDAAFRTLEAEVAKALAYEPGRIRFERAADLRYAGQAFELTIPLPAGPLDAAALHALSRAFEAEHERTYGHRFGGADPLEIVSLRATGIVTPRGRRTLDPARAPGSGGTPPAPRTRAVYFGPDLGTCETPVLTRAHLAGGMRPGPAIIEDYEGTTVVPPDAQCGLDAWGNIAIDLPAGGTR